MSITHKTDGGSGGRIRGFSLIPHGYVSTLDTMLLLSQYLLTWKLIGGLQGNHVHEELRFYVKTASLCMNLLIFFYYDFNSMVQ